MRVAIAHITIAHMAIWRDFSCFRLDSPCSTMLSRAHFSSRVIILLQFLHAYIDFQGFSNHECAQLSRLLVWNSHSCLQLSKVVIYMNYIFLSFFTSYKSYSRKKPLFLNHFTTFSEHSCRPWGHVFLLQYFQKLLNIYKVMSVFWFQAHRSVPVTCEVLLPDIWDNILRSLPWPQLLSPHYPGLCDPNTS